MREKNNYIFSEVFYVWVMINFIVLLISLIYGYIFMFLKIIFIIDGIDWLLS